MFPERCHNTSKKLLRKVFSKLEAVGGCAIMFKKTLLYFEKLISVFFFINFHRCFGMLLSPGRNVKNSDMHLLDMVILSFNSKFSKIKVI